MEDYKDEIWKPVNGLYHVEVSNKGRVRGWLRPGRHKNKVCDTPHIKNPHLFGGHPMVNVAYDGGYVRTTKSVARLVLAAFVGPMEDGYKVVYKDGNVQNVSLDNLCYQKTKHRIKDEEAAERKKRREADPFCHGAKPVAMLDCGEVVAVYKTAKDAAEHEGFDSVTIRHQAQHRRGEKPINGTTITFRYCSELGIKYTGG